MYRPAEYQQQHQQPQPSSRKKRPRHRTRPPAGAGGDFAHMTHASRPQQQAQHHHSLPLHYHPHHQPHAAHHQSNASPELKFLHVPNPGSGDQHENQGPAAVVPLSNTQLKKLRVKEWREKQKLGLVDMDDPTIDPNFTPAITQIRQDFGPKATVTKQLAIDCEMVGAGPRGCRDMLARVSIVNTFGDLVYDKYVQPIEPVTDYRSFVSGIYPQHLSQWSAVPFPVVQREVCDLLRDRVLVGHAIKHDLRVLFLNHPPVDIRDTSLYFDAAVYGGRGTPSLRKLTEHFMGLTIQSRAHDSVEDARATMRLYTLFRREWEAKLMATGGRNGQR